MDAEAAIGRSAEACVASRDPRRMERGLSVAMGPGGAAAEPGRGHTRNGGVD